MADNTQGNQPQKKGVAVEELRIGTSNCWAVRWPDGHISISNFPTYAQPDTVTPGGEPYQDVFTWELFISSETAKRGLLDLLQKSLGE